MTRFGDGEEILDKLTDCEIEPQIDDIVGDIGNNNNESSANNNVDRLNKKRPYDTLNAGGNVECPPKKLRLRKSWSFQRPSLKIRSSFWSEFLIGNNKMKDGWTNALNKIFEQENSYKYCNLSFGNHHIYGCKNGEITFSSTAHCKNSLCTEYKLTFKGKPQMQDFTEINVYHETEIKHKEHENHKRNINGQERDELKTKVEGKSGLRCQEEILVSADQETLKKGNFNHVPSLDTIHKIQSEARKEKFLNKDTIECIYRLIEDYNTKWKSKKLNYGFIQKFGEVDFVVHLYTEEQLRVLLKSKPGFTFCDIDATGKLIKKLHENSSKVYYYTLLLPGNEEQRIGPFPVAEFVSSRHNIPTITDFLNHFVYDLQSLDPHRIPLIDKIETDFSLALLQSCCKALNECNLTTYMNKAYKSIEKLSRMTVIHICSSHMLNTARRHFKSLKIQKDELDVAMEAVSNLIHCTTVEAAEHVFEAIIKIFMGKVDDKERKEIIAEKFNFQSINIDKTLLSEKEKEVIKKMPWSNSNYLNSFHHRHFKIVYTKTIQKYNLNDYILLKNRKNKTNVSKTNNGAINDSEDRKNCLKHDSESDNDGLSDTSCSSSDEENDADEEIKGIPEKTQQDQNPQRQKFYCLEIIHYILMTWLPYYPLWSASVIKKFKILRDSNASIENWHKIMKPLFDNRKNVEITEFIQEQAAALPGRLDDPFTEESWKRGPENRRKKQNSFFKIAKEINKKSNEDTEKMHLTAKEIHHANEIKQNFLKLDVGDEVDSRKELHVNKYFIPEEELNCLKVPPLDCIKTDDRLRNN
ncbi:Similar to NOF: 120.7 kDa protein in NOF-FB transposable element (Drosophila melanogaster) [Cotesia congregata]|uniref:Similar to NOF: 120.7 kDa protein in NOF-FB transposable element (Drosophila melanogaster) n=1 Tax=Cotesia congregata TaxID=51543 RepID=A0A8J2EA90_COTCN|nr:Similar to NOF: 120.7 kDa protein in NOF-FB transposable element (Drosophila melanogaster) [Cotesia congregata]